MYGIISFELRLYATFHRECHHTPSKESSQKEKTPFLQGEGSNSSITKVSHPSFHQGFFTGHLSEKKNPSFPSGQLQKPHTRSHGKRTRGESLRRSPEPGEKGNTSSNTSGKPKAPKRRRPAKGNVHRSEEEEEYLSEKKNRPAPARQDLTSKRKAT